jgi:hypothetical protein
VGAVGTSRYTTTCGWSDAPHLDAQTMKELLDSTPPHLRKARSEGVPSLGEGAIYPIDFDEISVDPFPIPDFWPRAYGLDVGWKMTAGIWGARDPDTNVHYLYAEHYRGQAEPSIHATAIKARGEWIPGVIDYAGTNPHDGTRTMALYRELGLDVEAADKSVETGLALCWQMYSTGMLKVFRTLSKFRAEYNLYRRETTKSQLGVETSKILKKDDHLMDAKRYLMVSGFKRAITRPVATNRGTAHRGDPVVGY